MSTSTDTTDAAPMSVDELERRLQSLAERVTVVPSRVGLPLRHPTPPLFEMSKRDYEGYSEFTITLGAIGGDYVQEDENDGDDQPDMNMLKYNIVIPQKNSVNVTGVRECLCSLRENLATMVEEGNADRFAAMRNGEIWFDGLRAHCINWESLVFMTRHSFRVGDRAAEMSCNLYVLPELEPSHCNRRFMKTIQNATVNRKEQICDVIDGIVACL